MRRDEPAFPAGEGGLVRLRAELAYDGTDFSGWARQRDRRTVQHCVEDALATVLRIDPPAVTVAGRTDAGVHALAQVIHVDVAVQALAGRPLERLARQVDGVLPPDVRLHTLELAAPGFDARFAALWREYVYRICDDRARANPVRRRDTLDWPRHLDVEAMATAAGLLVGVRDFAAFCRPREGATTIRELQRFQVHRRADVIECVVRADAFCHSMVRSLVGALIAVGEGRKPADWPAGLLDGTERAGSVAVAAAHGLTLMRVHYPADAELAHRTALTRAVRS